MSVLVGFSGDREIGAPPAETRLSESVWNAWLLKGRSEDEQNSHARKKLVTWMASAALTVVVACGAMAAANGSGDLSRYRNFQLGTDLATVAGQAGTSAVQAKVIERRPALIQELEWRPQPLGPSAQVEAAKEVVFSFYDGKLYQIAVSYDRYKIEGLTDQDVIESVSAAYGPVAARPVPVEAASGSYSDAEEVVARWEDAEYRIDLVRVPFPYGPSFRLLATAKHSEALVQAALVEARRLDDKEAPQREAARVADEAQVERTRLEKARLVNKPKFRP